MLVVELAYKLVVELVCKQERDGDDKAWVRT